MTSSFLYSTSSPSSGSGQVKLFEDVVAFVSACLQLIGAAIVGPQASNDVASFLAVVDDGLVTLLVLVNFAMGVDRIGEAQLDTIEGDVLILTSEDHISIHLNTDT